MSIDTHAHPQDTKGAAKAIRRLKRVSRVALMSVDERDWSKCKILHKIVPNKTYLGFGVHPWQAAGVKDGWLDRLRAELMAHPRAFVGEIGLDKLAVWENSGKVEFEKQLQVFEAQLDLASELSRPVSVHCVKAHGPMLALLAKKANKPPAVILHSFSGKQPLVRSYLCIKRLNVYFGFSSIINMRAEARTLNALAAVPIEKLLLETDINDAKYMDQLMQEMIQIVCQAKELTAKKVVETCNQSAKEIFEFEIEVEQL